MPHNCGWENSGDRSNCEKCNSPLSNYAMREHAVTDVYARRTVNENIGVNVGRPTVCEQGESENCPQCGYPLLPDIFYRHGLLPERESYPVHGPFPRRPGQDRAGDPLRVKRFAQKREGSSGPKAGKRIDQRGWNSRLNRFRDQWRPEQANDGTEYIGASPTNFRHLCLYASGAGQPLAGRRNGAPDNLSYKFFPFLCHCITNSSLPIDIQFVP